MQLKFHEKLFEFKSFEDWVVRAQDEFTKAGRTSQTVICLDELGRACLRGKHFKRAKKEKAFPVAAYALIEEEY